MPLIGSLPLPVYLLRLHFLKSSSNHVAPLFTIFSGFLLLVKLIPDLLAWHSKL